NGLINAAEHGTAGGSLNLGVLEAEIKKLKEELAGSIDLDAVLENVEDGDIARLVESELWESDGISDSLGPEEKLSFRNAAMDSSLALDSDAMSVEELWVHRQVDSATVQADRGA